MAAPRDELLAIMSHELRTPLTIVIGSAELLLETVLDDEQRQAAESVQRAGRVLLGIVNDVLDYSKLEAGELELECADFDLRAALGEPIESLRPQAERQGVDLSWSIASDVPGFARGDSFRLEQIVATLVSNAIKFGGGSVCVTASSRPLGDREFELECRVTDTGIGFSNLELDRLFEPFHQADGSSTRRFGGAGLGLAIAKRLTALLGGEIGASGEPARGSSFWFRVPLAIGDSAAVRQSRKPPRHFRSSSPVSADAAPRRLLLAEDNETNRALIEKTLAPLGHRIDCVRTGREAIEALGSGDYQLCLMDCQMPELDGFEAARAIRELERGERHVPIVALTANALSGDRERCLAAGMDDYLAKPFSIAELRHKVKLWLLPEPVAITVAAPNPGLVISDLPPNAGPAIDPGRLREIGASGGREFVHELMKIFADDARRRLVEIEGALTAGNAVELRRAAHGLRGAAANVGAERLSELAARLEQAAANGRTPKAIFDALRAECERVDAVLSSQLDALLASAGVAQAGGSTA